MQQKGIASLKTQCDKKTTRFFPGWQARKTEKMLNTPFSLGSFFIVNLSQRLGAIFFIYSRMQALLSGFVHVSTLLSSSLQEIFGDEEGRQPRGMHCKALRDGLPHELGGTQRLNVFDLRLLDERRTSRSCNIRGGCGSKRRSLQQQQRRRISPHFAASAASAFPPAPLGCSMGMQVDEDGCFFRV